MSASKSLLFAYSSLALIILLGLAPLAPVGAKTITIGSSSTDIIEIPGLLVNTSLTGAGNRCLYVDGNNQLSVKGFDCGSSTGGDNLGDHSAAQNLRLNSFWLSGDGGNEGIQIGSTGNLTTSGIVSFTGVVYAGGGNRMITVDNAGVLGAASLPTALPTGTTNYTLRYNGTSWVSDGNIYNNGTNVGIGTTGPGAKLDVKGVGRFTRSDATNYLEISDEGGTGTFKTKGEVGTTSYNGFQFVQEIGNATTQRVPMVIDYLTGNVGIGTTGPLTSLHVVAPAVSGGEEITRFGISDNNSYISFRNNTSVAGKFAPSIYGLTDDANYQAYLLMGDVNGVDSGTKPAIELQARAGAGVVGTRPLFAVTSYDQTKLLINKDGNVGIGTTNPLTKLQVSTPTNANAMTLGSANGVAFSVKKAEEGYGLHVGIAGSGTSWIQSGSTAGATAYDLSLQASGGNVLFPGLGIWNSSGNVGIGITTPTAKLDVNGSFMTNSSITFRALAEGGTRILTVDNDGNVGATRAPDVLPSGTVHQTLRHNGLTGWAADSFMYNTGSTLLINYNGTFCDTSTKVVANGQIMTPSVHFSQPLNAQCTPGAYITFNTGNRYLQATGGLAYTFDAPLAASGLITADGFKAGLNTGISGTVIVKGSTGVNCNLVFTGGILTSETCP